MASSLTGISIASSYDSLLKVGDNDGLSASLQVISDGLGTETGISLNNAGDLTATGTITGNSFVGNLSGNISGNSTISGTLTFGSLSDGTITITDIKDEDNMSSDSATALATQQSIKAYVDAQVTASDLDFQGDSGGVQSIDLDSETFTIAGTTNEIQTTSAGNALTVSLNPNISGLTSVAATTFTGALTGNSSTTTALATSRNIAGVAFDGTSDISLTTDNITEGSNLYYTTARFDSAFTGKSTTDLSEGTNLYYTDARADARIALNTGSNLDLSSKSTSDLSEGSNLYFTDERVDDRVSNLVVGGTGITATYDDAANSLTITNSSPDQTVSISASNGVQTGGTYPSLTVAGTDASTSAKGVASFSSSHFSVSSGAVSIAADSIDDTLIDFGTGANQVNTDDLPEGSTNLYLTNERIDDQVASLIVGGSGISAVYDDSAGTLTLNNTASGIGLADFSAIDAGGDGSFSYNSGTGAFTYTGPSTSEVQAHITKSYVDGLGIAATTAATLANARTINGSSFDGSANISFDTDAVSEGSSNLYYTSARSNADFDTRLATKDTADLAEGTNLYFTDARVDSRLAATAQTIDGNGSASGTTIQDGGISVRTGTGSVAYVDLYCEVSNAHRVRVKSPAHSAYSGNVDLTLPTTTGTLARTADIPSDTDGLTEGSSNLYYTDARANSAFDTRLATKDTDNLTEGSTNLYYTDARFDTRLGTKTTDNLTQGSTNLYNQTHTGDVTGATALTIASDAVTYDKMQDLVTANRVLGGTAAGTIAEVQIATDMVANGAITSAKVDTDLRNVEYIGLDSGDYIQFADNSHVDMYINSVHKFRFEADGDFHADGDVIAYSTTTPSDERLKENVKVIDNALDKLDQLRGVTFDWIDRDDKRSGGIIAQELEKVMPELVKEVDSLKSEDSFKAVDYNGLIGLLIEAVKELSDKCNNCDK